VRGAADGYGTAGSDDPDVYPSQRNISVGNVMHRGVVSCDRDTPARKVASMMTAHQIHAVVVTSSADLPRLVTDTQIASALYADTLESARAGDIATDAPLVRLSDSLDEAVARMHEGASTHAVAVDRSFRPVGVVSVLDLVEAQQRKDAE
jgi:CBS domain-containing protein